MSGDLESLEPFLGVWVLRPTDTGPPGAVYTILGDMERLFLHARWTHEGVHEVRSEGIPDGKLRVVGEVQKRMILKNDALVTEVLEGEEVVHRAVRVVVDGQLHIDQGGSVSVYERSEVKQVLVYRRDLKMRKGKIAAQCAHGALAVFLNRDEGACDELMIPLDGPMAAWCKGRFAKIVLSVDSEEALLMAYSMAKSAGLPTVVITDAGHTEFHGVPTRTVVAIGPAAVSEIDVITGPSGLVQCKLA